MYWCKDEAPGEWSVSKCELPLNGGVAKIYVRDLLRRQRTENPEHVGTLDLAERYWSRAILELLNLESAEQYLHLYEDAIAGELTRESWIEKNVRLEHRACLKLKEFYRRVWMPFARGEGLRANAEYWHGDVPEAYEEWEARSSKGGAERPWSYWGNYFDDSVAPYLASKRGATNSNGSRD